MRIEIIKNNSAVVIMRNADGGNYRACLFVNARNGLQDADITTFAWKGKTEAGARRWADRMLAEA
jgi:hypothetical protein